MSTSRYCIHAVAINSTVFSGIMGYNIAPNLVADVDGHDGAVDPHFGSVVPAILEGKPMISLRSRDIKGVLDAIGIGGLVITNITLFAQKYQNLGTRASGSNHIKGVCSSALAIVRDLSPRHNQPADIGVDIYPLSSTGLAKPITWTTSQALSGSIAAFARYTHGPMNYTPGGGASTPVGNTAWSYDSGAVITHDSLDSFPYPDNVHFEERKPSFSVDTPDMGIIVAAAMQDGDSCAANFYLRKLADTGGARVANATAEHIKITVPYGLCHVSSGPDGNHGSQMSGSIRIVPVSNGSDDIVQIDTTSAIS